MWGLTFKICRDKRVSLVFTMGGEDQLKNCAGRGRKRGRKPEIRRGEEIHHVS